MAKAAKRLDPPAPSMADEIDDEEMARTDPAEEDVKPVRRVNFSRGKRLKTQHQGWWVPNEGEVVEGVLLGRQISNQVDRNGNPQHEYLVQLLSEATVRRINAGTDAQGRAKLSSATPGEVISFPERKALEPLKDLLEGANGKQYAIQITTQKKTRTKNGQTFWPLDVVYTEV